MYPELTPPLLASLAVAGLVLGVVAWRGTVLRRLALRQVARRPGESGLVVLGSVLGTAIIVGSLVVGDTLVPGADMGALRAAIIKAKAGDLKKLS